MPDKDNETGQKSKIETYVLCIILIILTFATQYMILKDIFPVLTDDLNENALTVIVIGFNISLFQIIWFTLRLSEARHNPNENTARLNSRDKETVRDTVSQGKMEVNVTVNQNKGDA